MIPEEISIQINQLKERVKTYSSLQRWMTIQEKRDAIDEIKGEVGEIVEKIDELLESTDNILTEGLVSDFNVENWFETLKDYSEFTEPNPRLVFEEKQRQIRLQEEREKQEFELQRRELERLRHVEEEKERLANEERNRLIELERKQRQIAEFNVLCYNGPDDIQKLQELLSGGLDLTNSEKIHGLAKVIERGRSLIFIKYLVDAGMIVTKQDINFCLRSKTVRSKEILNLLAFASNIDSEAIILIKELEDIAKKKKKKMLKDVFIIAIIIVCICLLIIFFDKIIGIIALIVKTIMVIVLGFFFLLAAPKILKKR